MSKTSQLNLSNLNTLKHHRFIVGHSINSTFQSFICAFQRYFNTFHRINISLTFYIDYNT